MKVKDIQNIILSYDMDYDTIIEYSKEDLTTTLEGLSSSLETVIDNNNNYLINDILEYYIDIFDTIENIDDLDIYVNKIKKIMKEPRVSGSVLLTLDQIDKLLESKGEE